MHPQGDPERPTRLRSRPLRTVFASSAGSSAEGRSARETFPAGGVDRVPGGGGLDGGRSAAGGELAADVDEVAAQVGLAVEGVVGAGGAHRGVGGGVAGDGDDGAAVAGAAEVGDRTAAVLAAVAEGEVHEDEV